MKRVLGMRPVGPQYTLKKPIDNNGYVWDVALTRSNGDRLPIFMGLYIDELILWAVQQFIHTSIKHAVMTRYVLYGAPGRRTIPDFDQMNHLDGQSVGMRRLSGGVPIIIAIWATHTQMRHYTFDQFNENTIETIVKDLDIRQ